MPASPQLPAVLKLFTQVFREQCAVVPHQPPETPESMSENDLRWGTCAHANRAEGYVQQRQPPEEDVALQADGEAGADGTLPSACRHAWRRGRIFCGRRLTGLARR